MSVLHPVGPLPPRVYWVRRLLVAAAAVLVLLLAAWAWGALTGDDGQAAGPGAGQSQSPAASTSGSPSTSPSESPDPSVSSSPSPSKSATGTPQCADDDISVVATPDRTSYAPDQDPHFTVKVTNTSKKACKRDVGQKAMEVRVSKGDTVVWSSDHCNPGGETKVVTLAAGKAYSTAVIWSRTTSKAGCPDNAPDAGSGTYALTGRNLKIVSDPVAFALT